MTCLHCDGRIVYCECGCNYGHGQFIHVEGNTAYCRSLPGGEWLKAVPHEAIRTSAAAHAP